MTIQRFQQLSHWSAYTAVVENGRFIRAEPFGADQAPSPMLGSMPEMVYSPLRVARPAVREGWLKQRAAGDRSQRGRERFVEVSWEVALDLVAGELARVRAEHGPTGIFGGSYGWASAGRVHHARTLVRRFLFSGGGCVDQIGNYSFAAGMLLMPHVVGSADVVAGKATDWTSVMAHTKCFVAFGGLSLKNGQVSPGGLGNHTMHARLQEAYAAGVRFVVVSPTQMDVPADLHAQWIQIRPNTDTAMLLAMAQVLITEGGADREFLVRCCVGFERLEQYLLGAVDGQPKTPQWASTITGVPADVIRTLGLRIASERSMMTMAWSLQRAHRGEQPYWSLVALAAIAGQIGLPGGGFAFGHGSIAGVGEPRMAIPTPEMPMGVNPAKSAIPVARITEMLERPGSEYDFNGQRLTYPNARIIYWAGGNPFHHHQDLNRLRRAWAKPELVVVHDTHWTANAKHADIVLPATTTLERNDIGASGRDCYVFAMQRAIAPVNGARNDFEIFRELAARAGHEAAFTEERESDAWIRHLYANVRERASAFEVALPAFDVFWKQGFVKVPAPREPFVYLAEFRADPDGHRLKTPSGKIELYSERIASFGYADSPPHPMWLEPIEYLGSPQARDYPIHLITIQPPDRLHSQLDPVGASRAHKIKGHERVWLNPADAHTRGVVSGDVVRLFNGRGSCLAGAELDARVGSDTAVISTGAWCDLTDPALEPHGNPNALTLDIATSSLTQAPAALSLLVQFEKWRGTTSPSNAWSVPELVSA